MRDPTPDSPIQIETIRANSVDQLHSLNKDHDIENARPVGTSFPPPANPLALWIPRQKNIDTHCVRVVVLCAVNWSERSQTGFLIIRPKNSSSTLGRDELLELETSGAFIPHSCPCFLVPFLSSRPAPPKFELCVESHPISASPGIFAHRTAPPEKSAVREGRRERKKKKKKKSP